MKNDSVLAIFSVASTFLLKKVITFALDFKGILWNRTEKESTNKLKTTMDDYPANSTKCLG